MSVWIDSESMGGIEPITVNLNGDRKTAKSINKSDWAEYKKKGYQKIG